MGIKFLFFFGMLFFFSFLFIFLKEPYQKQDQNIAYLGHLMKFEGIETYEILENGIKNFAIASSITRFKSQDEAKDLTIQRIFSDGTRDKIVAKNGVYKDGKIELSQNVAYEKNGKNGELKLKTQNAIYDIEQKILTSSNGFEAENRGHLAFGNSFVYEQNSGFLRADKIKMVLKVQ